MDQFIGAVIVAVAGIFVTAIISAIRMLAEMRRDVRSLVPSVQAIYAMQPFLIKSSRHQNDSFRKLGANGSTDKSDGCLDQAEACLDRRLVERVGGCA